MRKELIVHRKPKSPNSETFRTLRTNIQFMNKNKGLKTLLVTSTLPGEGKSWVTSNLAVTFAQAGKRVVLIDADMRKGRQYAIFGISPRPGLSNYLSEAEVDEEGKASISAVNYIQETEVDNLFVITAGSVPPNPSELLVSPQMLKLIDELKPVFDVIIIDGTPCELVTDSIILSRIVDSCIIVAAHKITKKETLNRIIKNIQSVGGNLAGVVLNKVPVSKKQTQYYYYGETKSNSKQNKFNKPKIDLLNSKAKSVEKRDENIAKLQNRVDPLPKALSKEIKEEKTTTSKSTTDDFLKKTNEIMQQINAYIDEEKKNLN